MQTLLNSIFGCEYPIIQATMNGIIKDAGKLSASISEAGGFGIISGIGASSTEVEREIKIAKKLTNAPFGVGIVSIPTFEGIGVNTGNKLSRTEKIATTNELKELKLVIEIILDEKIPVVTITKANSYIVDKLKSQNIKIIAKHRSLNTIDYNLKNGVDAIILKGEEGAGFSGHFSTRKGCSAYHDMYSTPFIVSGGIASAKDVKHYLKYPLVMGIQIGTRFLGCKELFLHENMRKEIINAKNQNSVVIGNKDLTPIRALVTPNSYKWVGKFSDEAVAKIKNKTSLGLSSLLRDTIKSGDIEHGVIFAGTGVGHVTKIQSTKEIIEELTEEL